jgi:hypothetical protein
VALNLRAVALGLLMMRALPARPIVNRMRTRRPSSTHRKHDRRRDPRTTAGPSYELPVQAISPVRQDHRQPCSFGAKSQNLDKIIMILNRC